MVKTVKVSTDITSSHELHIRLPDDVPIGPAEVVLHITSAEEKPTSTLGDLLQSELFGIWRDREDISDSSEFADKLRKDTWKRSA